MIKSRRMRCAGHVARMGRRGMHIGYWWESQKKETTRKTKTKGGGWIILSCIGVGVTNNNGFWI
jgi:hypothetical protein